MAAIKQKTKQKGFELVSDNWIEKSNVLNEVRNNRMTISQIRLFSIYLSKINPRDVETREVTFKLDEYAKVMQFKQVNTTRLVKTAEDLLGLTVKYFDKTGEYSSDGLVGFVMCQIFKRFKLYKNEDDGEWYVSIDCHDDVLRLMFDLQKYYFTYELWNALQLTSPNQQRMYEILKQYEKVGERIVTIRDLRDWLGIEPKEYPRWDNFKTRVLDASQEALARYTDIKFTWEVTGKRGKGGKINALKFTIEKNYDYERQYTIDDYLIEQKTDYEDEPEEFVRPHGEDGIDTTAYEQQYIERIKYFMEACDGEFTFTEVVELDKKLSDIIEPAGWSDEDYCYHHLEERYQYMTQQSDMRKIPNRLDYMKTITEQTVMPYIERIEFLMESCKHEFTFSEVVMLNDKMRTAMSYAEFSDQITCYHYLNNRYKYMDLQSKRRDIPHRYKYLLSILGAEI